MNEPKLPETRAERMRAAVRAVNPYGWSYIPQRDGYAEDFAYLQRLISSDPELVHETVAPREYTLLHFAAWGDGDEIGDYLLSHGARFDARAAGGATPLAVACTYAGGFGALAKRLAEQAFIPSNLRTAVALGRMDLVRSFFKSDGSLKPNAGRDRDDWDKSYEFPARPHSDDPTHILGDAFDYAARNNQIEVAEFLLNMGADPNAISYLAPPLSWAALYGHVKIVDFLLEHGADPNLRDDEHNALPWEWAAFFEHHELATTLKNMLK